MLQAVDARIAQALDCPCVEDLKAGPCGQLFVSTFTCFHKSRAEPKGCDCLDVSLAFAVSPSVALGHVQYRALQHSRLCLPVPNAIDQMGCSTYSYSTSTGKSSNALDFCVLCSKRCTSMFGQWLLRAVYCMFGVGPYR